MIFDVSDFHCCVFVDSYHLWFISFTHTILIFNIKHFILSILAIMINPYDTF